MAFTFRLNGCIELTVIAIVDSEMSDFINQKIFC